MGKRDAYKDCHKVRRSTFQGGIGGIYATASSCFLKCTLWFISCLACYMETKINLLIIFITCLFYIVCASADGSSFDYRIIIYLRRWCIVSIYSDILYVIVHSHSCFCLSFCKYQYLYMLATPLFLLMFL
jgi:hypothetical protein